MTSVLKVTLIIATVLLLITLWASTKPIDCVISDHNPYISMPDVCKAVLKVPSLK